MTADVGVSVERTAGLRRLREITGAEIMEPLVIPQHNLSTEVTPGGNLRTKMTRNGKKCTNCLR